MYTWEKIQGIKEVLHLPFQVPESFVCVQFYMLHLLLFPPANCLVLVVDFDATGLHLETQSNLGGESKLMWQLKYGKWKVANAAARALSLTLSRLKDWWLVLWLHEPSKVPQQFISVTACGGFAVKKCNPVTWRTVTLLRRGGPHSTRQRSPRVRGTLAAINLRVTHSTVLKELRGRSGEREADLNGLCRHSNSCL